MISKTIHKISITSVPRSCLNTFCIYLNGNLEEVDNFISSPIIIKNRSAKSGGIYCKGVMQQNIMLKLIIDSLEL